MAPLQKSSGHNKSI